jgi:hypothetical protein
MLKFDPKAKHKAGDVLLVEVPINYGISAPGDTIFGKIGHQDVMIPEEAICGIARRAFAAGEEVLVGTGKGKVIASAGEWLWIDIGGEAPVSTHAESVSRIDDAQPDLLAG